MITSKKFTILLLFLFLFLVFTLTAQIRPGDLRVKYRPNNMSQNQMGFLISIENVSGLSINLDEVKVFYYFTNEIASPYFLDTNSNYTDNLELILHTSFYPESTATELLELNFSSAAGSLSNGSSTSEIEIKITGASGTTDRTNDYSYTPLISSNDPLTYHKGIILTYQDKVVWGAESMGQFDQTSIVSGGYYNETDASSVANGNKKVRNDDGDRVCLTTGNKVVFDFKDIYSATDFNTIEKITLKVLHFEDNIFDNNDLLLTIGTGLKPGETEVIRESVYMPTIGAESQEDYFSWDITEALFFLSDFNNLQLRLSFNTTTNGTVRLNRIHLEIDYSWEGKYNQTAIALGNDYGQSVSLDKGYIYVSLPASSGTLTIVSDSGFAISTEGLNSPSSTMPAIAPYYTAVYPVTSSIVKIIRSHGDRSLWLKYSY